MVLKSHGRRRPCPFSSTKKGQRIQDVVVDSGWGQSSNPIHTLDPRRNRSVTLVAILVKRRRGIKTSRSQSTARLEDELRNDDVPSRTFETLLINAARIVRDAHGDGEDRALDEWFVRWWSVGL